MVGPEGTIACQHYVCCPKAQATKLPPRPARQRRLGGETAPHDGLVVIRPGMSAPTQIRQQHRESSGNQRELATDHRPKLTTGAAVTTPSLCSLVVALDVIGHHGECRPPKPKPGGDNRRCDKDSRGANWREHKHSSDLPAWAPSSLGVKLCREWGDGIAAAQTTSCVAPL